MKGICEAAESLLNRPRWLLLALCAERCCGLRASVSVSFFISLKGGWETGILMMTVGSMSSPAQTPTHTLSLHSSIQAPVKHLKVSLSSANFGPYSFLALKQRGWVSCCHPQHVPQDTLLISEEGTGLWLPAQLDHKSVSQNRC